MNDRSAAPTPWPLTSSRYSPSRSSGSGTMPRPSPARSTQGWKAWATRRAPAVTSRAGRSACCTRAASRMSCSSASFERRSPSSAARRAVTSDCTPMKCVTLARAVPDRRDRQPVPERAAVLAVVQDLDNARTGFGQRRTDLGHRGRVGGGPLQEPAVPPHHVRNRVAGDPLEALVGVDQRLVRLARVGDGEPLGCDLERAVLQREPGGGIVLRGGRRRRVPGAVHPEMIDGNAVGRH